MFTTSNITLFLVGTFLISLAAFCFMLFIPAAQSPEGIPGLPIWFAAVWSPTIVALVIGVRSNQAATLLNKLITFRKTGWALVFYLIPISIFVGVLIFSRTNAKWTKMSPVMYFMLISLNLLLGPLGEEVGWRGFLQPALMTRFNWWLSSIIVAVIWGIWHAPLWLINSPQREIPFGIFLVHVLAYSLILGATSKISPHSLVPAVLLHLLFNVTSGLALIIGIASTPEWYRWTALPYLLIAITAAVFTEIRIRS